VAGHVGLELRYVVTKYPFESSRRFAEIQPNSGHRDYSRLSCGVGQMQLGSSGRIILSRRSCAELVIELHRSRFAAAYRTCDRKGPPILRLWLPASHMTVSQADPTGSMMPWQQS